MRGMILAAGRGERMGALTEATPKPLLKIGHHYLIEYAIAQCQRAGITELVINLAYHGDQIKAALGDGSRYGVDIAYSQEAERLETGGGIVNALSLLGDQPFVVLSSDVVSAYDLKRLPTLRDQLGHLVLVDNPEFHRQGDFGLVDGRLNMTAMPKYTFGNISVLHPILFNGCEPVRFPLRDVLIKAITAQKISGELYQGAWYNVGNPSQLAEVQMLASPDSLATL
jgi:MurNAc alpha-1-phosphate uridylyltransferase